MDEPIIYKLPKLLDLKDYNITTRYFEYLSPPKSSLGFNQHIHKTKNKMNDISKHRRSYLVVNPYETVIDDEHSIERDVEKFVNEKLLSRAHHKLWEIFMMFDLFPSSHPIITAHLAEGPGSFVQATINYREMYCNNKNDKHYAITLHSPKKSVKPVDEEYIKAHKNKLEIYKTHKDGDGDLTKLDTINDFLKEITGKCDFITADGGFDWKNENMQEQEAFHLILGQMLTALKAQKKGGSFVLKIFEIMTSPTLKLLCLLSHIYEDIYIVKPLTSRLSNSERYIVCIEYIGTSKQTIQDLEEILTSIKEKHYLENMYSKYSPPQEFTNIIIKSNLEISNKQMYWINKMIEYVEKGDFYGIETKNYENKQKETSKAWLDLYLIDKNKLSDMRKQLMQIRQNIISKNITK